MDLARAARRTVAALALAALAGCGGGDPTTPLPIEPPLRLLADPGSTAIAPSQGKDVVFRLLTQRGAPVPGRVIQFSMPDDPATAGHDAGGATLSVDRGVTNDEGVVGLQIIAGPAPTTFRVRASAPRAPDVEVVVLVIRATHAPVEVVPVLADPVDTGPPLTTVRLQIVEAEGCASIRPDQLPPETPFTRTIPSDSTALFSTVDIGASHQVVAVALDGDGQPRAGGCVDLPGGLLLVDVPLRLLVPLHFFRLGAVGRFEVTSLLPLEGALRARATLIEAWRELSLCPLDPARLWLDCTIDALETAEADPADCRPGEREGPLGAALSARRGVRLPTPAGGSCRDRTDSAGSPSLDLLAAGLFPTPRPRLFELAAIAGELARLLEVVELRSTLEIAATSSGADYRLQHRLIGARFPLGTALDLVELGAPALEARSVTGVARADHLEIGTHAFTLRLGSVARLVFGRTSLVSRGAPAGAATDVGSFVNALAAAASHDEAGTALSGCAALDALLCQEVAQPRGCLMAACTTGLEAMRRRLDAGFAGLDGDDLDFVVGGTIRLLDRDGDRRADALGSDSDQGLWSGEVRGRGGSNLLVGSWTASAAP